MLNTMMTPEPFPRSRPRNTFVAILRFFGAAIGVMLILAVLTSV